jgi:uncharacterized membrane protein YfcA
MAPSGGCGGATALAGHSADGLLPSPMPSRPVSWLSAAAPWLLTWQTALLLVGGFFVGIFSVIVGGGFFLSVPLFQVLFPGVTYGAIVGNLKVGSFFRGIGSTVTNRKEIDWLLNVIWSVPLIIGTVLGVMVIAELHQRWLLPAIIGAIALSEYAPKLAKRITPHSFQAVSVATGAYAGFLGAGIGIILVALFRLRHPEDEKIAHVKIQARFIEWLIGIVAVIAHYFHGNLILALWLVWSVGSFAGGLLGGVLLEKLGAMPGGLQKRVLRLAYVVALAAAVLPFLP